MTFYTFPHVNFEQFEKESYFWEDHYSAHRNIMTNLIRYCGFRTLHKDCWLYKWLQEQIRFVKFSGAEEMSRWVTFPNTCEFWEKMPTAHMKVNREQMARWIEYLHDNRETIAENCKGDEWTRYFRGNFERSVNNQ